VDLHSAARDGDVAAVAGLVDDGADLDARDHNGMTPLMQAIWRGHAAAARLLIERGSDLAITDLGGSNARDWAEVLPEVIPLLDQRHAVQNRIDTIEHPYDDDGLDPRTTAFLARLRHGGYLAAADPVVLARLRPDMPTAVKALLHTWAHRPVSSWTRVGVWEVQRRSLHTGLPAGMPLPEGVESQRTICVGVNELGEWLIITWAADGSTSVWSFHRPTRRLRPIAASLEEFLDSIRPGS
jgi:Ankyrin repeats (many copies)